MLDALYATMNSLGISRAVMASHSYGTVIAAHVIRDQVDKEPHSSRILKPLITGQLLVDPVCLLLHLPDVAYNFLYRVPREANEWQLWYLASQDPDIAYALSRCFFWADNILWKEDFISESDVPTRPKTAVILSGDDQILRAPAIRRYLTGEAEVRERWSDGSLEVLYYPGLDHATVFDTRERRQGMVRILEEFTSRSDRLST